VVPLASAALRVSQPASTAISQVDAPGDITNTQASDEGHWVPRDAMRFQSPCAYTLHATGFLRAGDSVTPYALCNRKPQNKGRG
jgi:hypothetical protein